VAIHANDKDDYAFLRQLIQPILLSHGGRPHWGKLHCLAGLYPHWDDSLRRRAESDPQRRC
jgi:hypothetical protein